MTKRTTPRRVKAVARTWEFRNAYGHYCGEEPIWSLPRTRAAYDAMVEQGRKELAKSFDADQSDVFREYHETVVRLTLKSIGITRPIMRGDMTGNMGGRT